MARRITVAILGMVLASLLLSGIGTFLLSRLNARQRELTRIEQQAEAIAEIAPAGVVGGGTTPGTSGANPNRPRRPGAPSTTVPAQGTRQAELRDRIARIVRLTGVTEVRIRPNGELVGQLPSTVPSGQFDTAALRRGETISGARLNALWAATGRPETNGATTVIVVTAQQDALFGPTLRWFVVFGLAAVAVGVLVAVVLGRRLARPVHAAVDTTRRLAAGDLSARLHDRHTTDDDELAVLARSINAMAGELERSRGLERQFLMSVSHDLRTPLTSIRGYAEAIADGVAPEPQAAAEVIRNQADRLERLVGDLLDLARLDARQFDFRITTTAIAPVIDAAARSIAAEATAAGIELVVAPSPSAVVSVDPDRLAQAIGNLSTNAMKFARTAVWVRARLEGRAVAIDVADDGVGIPAADLPHVFERLYQAANSPERKESGSGLGLAIVRELVDGMGGTVEVASVEGTGTTFTIRLPLSPATISG